MEDSKAWNAENEAGLIRRAAEGDRGSFDVLVERCAEQIFGLAFRLTGKEADAEDLAQDALVSAFRNIGRFEQRCSFSSWVYRITLNLWKNKVKYEKRRFFLRHFSLDKPVDTEDGEMPREFASSEPGLLESTEQADKSQRVQAVLNRLDEQERAVIILCDIEEKTYEEIAQALDCPLGTVKSRIARARESLRREWLKHNELP